MVRLSIKRAEKQILKATAIIEKRSKHMTLPSLVRVAYNANTETWTITETFTNDEGHEIKEIVNRYKDVNEIVIPEDFTGVVMWDMRECEKETTEKMKQNTRTNDARNIFIEYRE